MDPWLDVAAPCRSLWSRLAPSLGRPACRVVDGKRSAEDPNFALRERDCHALFLNEASHKPVVAAVANAIHDATGLRLRRAPFRPERVLEALRAQS